VGVTVTVQWNQSAQPNAMAHLKKAMAQVKPHQASIGIHEEDGDNPKIEYSGQAGVETLAEAMIQHEYGILGKPERSFLRTWFDTNVSSLAAGMVQAMTQEMLGDKSAVERWVSDTKFAWRAWIESGPFVALSPRTVAAKTAAGLPSPDDPLIATKQFIWAWRSKLDGSFV